MQNKDVVDRFENLYKKGYNKEYPLIELVRLERLFLDKNKNITLDYGAGHGENGIHLLKKGYKVFFCDISKRALKITKRKVNKKYNKQAKYIYLKNTKQSNGKLIIDTNLRKNNYKVLKRINSTTILTASDKKNTFKSKMCFPKNINQFSKILSICGFKILDIGHSSFKVFHQFEKEILFCAVKKSKYLKINKID